MKKRHLLGLVTMLLLVTLLSVAVFYACYRYDNKYTAPGTQPHEGTLTLTAQDLADTPRLYLIRDWALYRDQLLTPSDFETNAPTPDEYTFIGQYGGFEKGGAHSPHGSATYRLLVHLPPETRSYTLELPEIFSAYRLYLNGIQMAQFGDPDPDSYRAETGISAVTIQAANQVEILVAVTDYSHFYSGMVYPPAFGISEAVASTMNWRFFLRVLIISLAVCIEIFYLCVWLISRSEKSRLPLLFVIFCACFTVMICYPVVKALLHGGLALYALEKFAYCALLLLVVVIQRKIIAALRFNHLLHTAYVAFGLCVCCWSLLLPLFMGDSLNLMLTYSRLIGGYAWLSAAVLLVTAIHGVRADAPHGKLLLTGAVIFAIALIMDRLLPMHEPILLGWFVEMAGCVLVLMVAYLLAADVARQLRHRLALELRVENVTKTMELQRAYYPVILDKEEQARAARHDFRHHIAVMREMLTQGNHEQLATYIQSCDIHAQPTDDYTYCDHYVIDMILRMYKELAQRQDTPLHIEAKLTQTITLPAVDLCVILSNLLENALEASARLPKSRRSVKISLFCHLNRLGIFIENNSDGAFKIKDGHYMSSKQKNRVGIGLASVQSVCAANNGSADFYLDDNSSFHAEVLLPMRKAVPT